MANYVTDETDKRTHRETKYRNIKFKSQNRGEGKMPTTRNRKLHPRGGANATFFCLHALSTHAAFVRKRQLYTNKRGKEKTIQTIHKTLHSALHSVDFPHVAKCRVCASNPAQTIHKTLHRTLHNGVQNSTLRRSKTYTEASTEPHVEIRKALPFREGLG